MYNFVDVLKKKNISHIVNDNGSIVISGDASLLGCTDITSLPENLSVGGSLDLSGTGITSLPENLSVGGSLYLRGTGITSLPENLSVGGSLDLSGTGITSLPENLSVGGSLDLSGTGITSLPENLSVGGYLYLRGTGITSLPENFSCDSLYLDPQRFDNVTYRENCGNSSRTIFATWVQGDFRIAAGCFLNTLDEFESAVDESYSGDAAETYKQAARDCVAELTVKLNKAGE
ncbi:hypothetical protein ACIPUO_06520 [Pectobacterium carotovorum]|uniref:hypothetical protein n=1 Tax=Pectobacterium carotovorum TaxID=554 RepID=UPI003806974E